jgi:hypothetical protein
MSDRFYKQKSNRSPESRRQYRKQVEGSEVSNTAITGDILKYESTNENLNNQLEHEQGQQLAAVAFGRKMQGGNISLWNILLIVFTIIGVVITLIVYSNRFTEKVTENKVNIQNIKEDVESLDDAVSENQDKLFDYIDNQIKTLKDDIKNFILPNK